jgi:hypothetical protein
MLTTIRSSESGSTPLAQARGLLGDVGPVAAGRGEDLALGRALVVAALEAFGQAFQVLVALVLGVEALTLEVAVGAVGLQVLVLGVGDRLDLRGVPQVCPALGLDRLRGPVPVRLVGRGRGLDVLGSVLAHQLYDLRVSGGGMLAPLYSTGIPPSG